MPELHTIIWPPDAPPVPVPPAVPVPPLNQSGIGHNLAKLNAEAALSFFEVDGYREHFADGDIQATRVFDVPWGQRAAFVQYMMGYSTSTLVPSPNAGLTPASGKISRVIPAQHPLLPYLYASRCELILPQGAYGDDPNVVAVDGNNAVVQDFPLGDQFRPQADPGNLTSELISIAGVPQPAGFPDPAKNLGKKQPRRVQFIRYYDSSTGNDGLARYAVQYTPRMYTIRDDNELATWAATNNAPGWAPAALLAPEMGRYVEREIDYAAVNLPVPSGVLQFSEGPFAGQPIGQLGNVLIMGTMQLRHIWHEVPDPPIQQLMSCVGKVNSELFDGLDGFPSYPSGTLLCLAPRMTRYRSATGRYRWRCQYNTVFRPQGWNNFPASDGNFYPVVNKTTGNPPYASTIFTTAFFLPPPPVTYQ